MDELATTYKQQMLDYFPEVIKQIREFQELIDTQSLQIAEIHQGLTKILENSYVIDCDVNTLTMWERFLEITPLSGSTVDDRRDAIIARLFNIPKLNSQSISNLVGIFTGGTATSYFKDGVIHVSISPPSAMRVYKFENVEKELRKRIPAHLDLEIGVSYWTWNEVFSKNQTWGDIKSNHLDWNDVLYHP